MANVASTAISHPITTAQTIGGFAKDSYSSFKNASDYDQGKMLGKLGLNVALFALPESKVEELGELGEIADEALVVRGGGLENQTAAIDR